jgi:transcriptional regulator of acetoin/glycerol metabolism
LPDEIRAASSGTAQLQEVRAGERFASLAQEHGGNVSAMARALGTSRSHVRRLAQRYHVDLSAERD